MNVALFRPAALASPALGCALACLLSTAPAQVNWTQRASSPSLPPARMQHAMAYDSVRQRVVLFGGSSIDAPGLFGDTWEWDGSRWTESSPTVAPPARASHRMAFDAARQRVILFGGTGGAAGWRGDTWEWDGTNWAQRSPATTPPARHSHAMSYDSGRQVVVMFGGSVFGGNSSDTWEWNGVDWTMRQVGTRPPERIDFDLAYDPVRQRTVLFGGAWWTGYGYVYFDDTWEWDGVSWSQRAPTASPGDVSGHSMAYDGSGIVLAGGIENGLQGRTDTWRWDGTSWTKSLASSSPPARTDTALVFDSARSRSVMFGGWFGPPLADLWEWDGTSWTQIPPGTDPGARAGHALTYDAVSRQVMMFGGSYGTGTGEEYPDGTWLWDGIGWNVRTTAQAPVPRTRHAMVLDVARGRVVLFGGIAWSGSQWTTFNDTWEWDGTSWTRMFPANAPSPRSGHGMAYDATRQRVIMFGGVASSALGDTWEWDGTDWTQLAPATSPRGRHGFALASDLGRGRIVLFGGWTSQLMNDTWEWDGTDWLQRSPATVPMQRTTNAMAYDSARQRVVLFGGASATTASVLFLADSWEWNGTDWTLRAAAASPPGRSSALAYDAGRGRMVLFGGSDRWMLGDSWEYAPLSPASYTSFGTACAGTTGTPALAAAPFSLPWAGDTFHIEVRNVAPGNAVFVVLGVSRTQWAGLPLPVDLSSIGMTGCTLDVAANVFFPTSNPTGTATLDLPLPGNPALIGGRFYNQAFVTDAATPLGLITSNAREATIGSR